MEDVIRLDNVFKTYARTWRKGPQRAVEDVSMRIAAGEAFGFVGPNGAGKSTTIKMLMGVIRPSAGEVQVLGRPVTDPQSRQGLGYVPENPSLPDYLTPREVMRMALALHKVRVDQPEQHAMRWLERFDLGQVADKVIRTFSKGMTQRVALAHAMVIKPRLLVLDEPLSGLDPVGRREVVDILGEYHQAGGTLFFSSHVLYDVERLADRFGLIHKGRLLTVRSPQELAIRQADGYVILFQSDLDTPVTGANLLRAGLFELEADEMELPAKMLAVLAAGGRIKEVRPKASLENVFLDLVQADNEAA